MSIQFNKLTFNGKSTADFPFKIYVIENDGINKAKRKDVVFTTNNMSGGITRTSKAYETVDKVYKLYLRDVKLSQLNDFLSWLEGSGKLIASDNPTRYYEVLTVSSIRSRIDEIDGYEIEVTFTCNPFSFSVNTEILTFRGNGSINNQSSTVMYPKITVYGNTNNETSLTIGKQIIKLKNINTKLVIECKQGEQNVYDKDGFLLNSAMRGGFFEIEKGLNGIVLGSGIERIEILCRWGEFI